MSTVTLLGLANALIGEENPDSQYSMVTGSAAIYDDRLFLIQMEQLSPTYEYSPINTVSLKVYGSYNSPAGKNFEEAYLRPILQAFNASIVTYNTRPTIAPENDSAQISFSSYGFKTTLLAGDLRAAIINGVCIDKRALFADDDGSYVSIYNVSSVYEDRRPRLIIEFGDGKNALLPTGNPQSGYVSPQNSIVLSWSTVESSIHGSYTTPEQASAVVSYRETGSEDVTTISVSTAQQVTIAANTWDPGTSYEWKVSVTDTGGSTNETPWYTLSTTAGGGLPPKLEFPINTAVDGSKPITFRWTNRGGENNTGTDLEFSTDGETWGAPINLAVGVDSYNVQAGTLPSGQNYWRARAYNAESVAGDWTNPALFVVISSPQAPYYEVTNSPRPTISWISDEQQAFQVQMGDYDSGMIFGTDQSFKCPVYLPNGSATVRVRVMNQYNLWSEWSGTQITIANSPGGTLPTLTATAGTDVQLTWTAVPGALKYLVYRDGALIGETGETNVRYFTADDLEVGSWSYSNKSASTTRCRSKELIPVANGTVISYAETTFDNYVGVLATTTSSSYRQSVNWTNGSGTLTITADSYMNLLLRTHSTPYAAFTPEDWNGTVTINTPEDMADKTFTDRYANGSVTYFIRAVLPDDNYAQSATVTVSVSVPCPMITALDGGWIELQYSTDPVHVVNSTHSQQVSMMVYSGHVYPVPEIAPHRQRSYQIQVAFRRGESGPFEALLGREVFLKDQYGAAIHGVIGTIAKAENRFYTVCSATLEEMEGAL